MAELAALANLAGVICCALKLSITLYEFGTSLGAAGREIKTLSTDITLFCSVLRQVQTTLGQVTKSFRISTNAIQTTQDILDKSSSIFDELISIFAKLQKDEKLPVDFLTRVRWTFKRAKVLLLRESLQSCTGMLHLMLTTMSFAQRIATKGTAFDDADDDEERALTHSLFLAQQTTKERLEELEKECMAEESQRSDSALTILASEQEIYTPYSPEEDAGCDSGPASPTSETIQDTVTIESGIRASKITSLLLGTILEQQKSVKKNNRLTWASVSSQQQSVLESDKLLRNWTDQRDPLAWKNDSSDNESLVPSDSVSRYHRHSHSESAAKNVSTFFESMTSSSDVAGAHENDISTDERPRLSAVHSADDAAFRSRQKVARLTGEDYANITADWMWRMNEQTGRTSLIPLPPLEPLDLKKPTEGRKKPKQLRWVNHRTSLADRDGINKEIEARLKSTGILP